ncbi:hypothetical protein IGB42_04271 [Andreprevotia sp. IGB-42]|nr:hypothetical protein IGB42_04271 [Andreprevotia sp. IGB-42]
MVVGSKRGAAYLLQQIGKGSVLIHLRAQHQCIDEETDQRFDLRMITVGYGRADA